MLEAIVESVRARLPSVVAQSAELQDRVAAQYPSRNVAAALLAPGLSVIAEIKRKSPSAGVIRADVDPPVQARRYEDGGAAMVSVLTERDHFGGSPADFEAVRSAVNIPLLRKDFVIDEIQVLESRALGADAVLLIVAILSNDQLRLLADAITDLGMTPLVEVHTRAEIERALDIGPQLVGINNRDLTTFGTDLATAEKFAPLLEDVPVTIGESGIWTADDAGRMSAAGYDGVLAGEALVRSEDPAALIAKFRDLP